MTSQSTDRPLRGETPDVEGGSDTLAPREQTPTPRRRFVVDIGDIGRRYAVLAVWAVMAVVFAFVSPDLFLNRGTAQIIFGGNGQLVFLCLAVLCPFCVGEFDFSVASMMGLAGTATAVVYTEHHWPIVVAVVFGVLLAVVAGMVNGALVVGLGVDPIITTLGMATALIGAALWLSHLTQVSGLPASFGEVVNHRVLGLPLFFFYGLALTLAFAYVLHLTPLGKHMSFVGANREVARLAGVRVARIRFGAFAFSGLISGLGGVLLAGNIGGYDPASSAANLLPALAATALGTAIFFPGRFNPLGAWVAVFFLETGIVGLQLLGLTGWITDAFFGTSLVVAVTLSTLLRRSTIRQ